MKIDLGPIFGFGIGKLPLTGGPEMVDVGFRSDFIGPTVVLTGTPADPSYSVTATFSENVTGFAVGDLTLVNCAASAFVAVSGSVYTFTITPSSWALASVQIGAGVCTDAAGNANTASNTLSRPDYSDIVLGIRPANLIAYWPLWEASGTVAYDISGNGRNGATSGATPGAAGIGDGRTSYLFGGINDYVNVFSASLAAALNGAEGTFALWGKVKDATTWNGDKYLVRLAADNDNTVYFQIPSANKLRILRTGGGTASYRDITGLTTLDFFHAAITWSESGNVARAYYAGAQQGADMTGLGTFVGTLAATLANLGCRSVPDTKFWPGSLAHAALWSTPLTITEIANLARVS